MNALDRYLESVKHFLPKARRDEILPELEQRLRSEIERRETELGRPLNQADCEAILARHGSPRMWPLAIGGWSAAWQSESN